VLAIGGGSIDSAYLDVLLVKGKAAVLVDEEVSDLDTVVALQLDHLAHTLGLGVTDDGAIAGWSRLVSSLFAVCGDATYQTPS
jgi:hypothetical protein